jgi:hypothetical protein
MTNGTSGQVLTNWQKYKDTYKKNFKEYRKTDKFKEYIKNYYNARYKNDAEYREYRKKKENEYYLKNREKVIERVKRNKFFKTFNEPITFIYNDVEYTIRCFESIVIDDHVYTYEEIKEKFRNEE